MLLRNPPAAEWIRTFTLPTGTVVAASVTVPEIDPPPGVSVKFTPVTVLPVVTTSCVPLVTEQVGAHGIS